MPVTLSIKNVPEALAERLRKRAEKNHRSLQGELLAILEATAPEPITIEELVRRVKASGLRTPSSVKLIRAMRDGGDERRRR